MMKISIIFFAFLALASIAKCHPRNATVPCVNCPASLVKSKNIRRIEALEDLYLRVEYVARSLIDAVFGPQPTRHNKFGNTIIIGAGNNRVNNLVLGPDVRFGVTYIVGNGDNNANTVVINN